MVWSNLILVARALHNVSKAYLNTVNAIATSVEPTPPRNIITNETIINQCSIKQGLKVFGKTVDAAVQNELKHFHNYIVVYPKNPCELTYEQRMKILEYLMSLKLHNDEVNIKVRGCTYGRNQWKFLSKENTTYQTVSTDGFIMLCLIDTMEVQDTVTAEIPESLLQNYYNKGGVNMNMEGVMVTLQ